MEIEASTFWNEDVFRRNRIMVTGAGGFKGSWLVAILASIGATVSGFTLPEDVSHPSMASILGLKTVIDWVEGDIRDYEVVIDAMRLRKPDIVFHLAAQPIVRQSYHDPLATLSSNIQGTAVVLEAARHVESVRVCVVVTSDKCYQNPEGTMYLLKETDPLGGRDPYSTSKAAAELVAESYRSSFFKDRPMGLATARAGNVIGGGDWGSDRLIPDVVRAWADQKLALIRHPEAIRPWQHVLEPLSGYLNLASKLWTHPSDFSSAWNFGPNNGVPIPVRKILEIMQRQWPGGRWAEDASPHFDESSHLALNISKAKELLAWSPTWAIDKAIYKTVEWYKQYYADPQNKNAMWAMTTHQIQEYARDALATQTDPRMVEEAVSDEL